MKKILLVEDEISYRSLLHRELTEVGYTVVDASDGKEGYNKALIVHPDLIILDILMPGIDGLTMLEALRKTREGKSMKAIILTNLELDGQDMKRVLDTKPLFYFVKSEITPSVLIAKVEEEFADQENIEATDENEERGGVL